MSIISLILDEYMTFAALLGLWIMVDSSVHLKKRTITVTRSVIVLIFVEAVLSSLETWNSQLDHLTTARIILTPTVYLLHPLIMIGILDMAEFGRKHRALLLLPVLISAPLLYTSQWTHLIYWFSPDNSYNRAASLLRYYPFCLFFLYILLFAGTFVMRYLRRGTSERKGILVCILIASFGLVFHIVNRMTVDYSLLFTSILLIYYLSLYVLTSKEDTLTHLMNRQCYFADSDKLKDRITAVVSVDMNDLKKINDSQGHDAGDTALITVAKCLTRDSLKNKRVYRIGGDEFAIFYLDKPEEAVREDIRRMQANLSETACECAFGFEMVDRHNIRKSILAADRKMYANKAAMKNSLDPAYCRP
ncbi:MAG: diguanylate cyclase [Clostridia bacterium]|nr:diguanylate cyclase [Clostridia bacterium]